jgi:hypothetical protein
MNKENLAKKSEYQRNYYHKNKDRELERKIKWQKENPDKVKGYKQNWYKKNKNSQREKHKKWLTTLDGFLARKIAHLKKAKRARILKVDIDLAFIRELWTTQDGKCAISNYPMTYPQCNLFSGSIDRIDSDGDYTKDNVQLVCQGINFAKNRYSNEEMIIFWNFRDTLKGENYVKLEHIVL